MISEPVVKHTGCNIPTIAFFGSSPGGQWNLEKWLVWRGIAQTAQEKGMNLIYVAGEEFENYPQAVLYKLIDSENVDGLIVWNSFVGVRSTKDKFIEFLNQYSPLPIVTIEIALDSCSSILVDNQKGVYDLLTHLQKVHNYQRIAFIGEKNNQASQERENAFRQYLVQEGLFDSRLVGELTDLDQRGLVPGIDYQAILAHSDHEAVRIVETLQQRGIRVPEDVAITGFNDGQDARGCLPPLTTVRLPFRSIGRQAVEMLARQLNGDNAIVSIKTPTQLILRRSCGCLEPMAEKAALGKYATKFLPLSKFINHQRNAIVEDLSHEMGTPTDSLAHTWAEKLFDIFINELKRYEENPEQDLPSTHFLQNLSEVLQYASSEGSNVSRWHEALTTLRARILPCLDDESSWFAEDMLQQARVLVGQAAIRSEVHQHWQSAQRAEILRDIEAKLLIALDENELISILVQGLRQLKITHFYLILYVDKQQPNDKARLRLAYQNGLQVEISKSVEIFSSHTILPKIYLETNGPFCLLVEALHLGQEQIGYVVFNSLPPLDASECDIYQAMRIQLSSALKGIALRQELQLAVHRAEEANQLKSRFLSVVSHELRTPLNLIVGLSEMALRQQSRQQGKKSNKAILDLQRSYLEQIYVSGQHLDRLIRDVLDLASSQVGQMKLVCEPLDLVPILNDAVTMCQQMAIQKNLNFYTEIPQSLPRVWADKTRVRQIVLNLLSNAIKFTAHGEVVLSATRQGKEIVISVRDTGLGIPKEDQSKIFDEFYQSDRSSTRGYGGIGLGLAITRKLVEKHNGRIWVMSNGVEGGGSTFLFTLPVMTEDIGQESGFKHWRADTVMILTNEPENAGELSNYLCKRGFEVEILSLNSQVEYLEEIVRYPPEAIILDFSPASEIGWEIMKVLKGNPDTQDIPVLFYSLVTEEKNGVVFELDYHSKPVGAEELLNALKKYGLKSSDTHSASKILIVDDDPGILSLQAQMIKEEIPNCQVYLAHNGKEGLESMRKSKPDLVLLDLLMPELDGFGVLTAMQEEHSLRNIPVIVLTGQTLTEREMNRLRQGVSTVLAKGLFTTDEILARIENTLARKKRWISEAQHLVQRAMVFIHEHYKEPISRSDIANRLCINEQYLSRCFKNEIGIGPMTYLSRYRIQQAKKLLERDELSITQIALAVGLSSQSYFSRLFQHETGISPSAYRRGEGRE